MGHHRDGSPAFGLCVVGLCNGSVRFYEAEHAVIVFVFFGACVVALGSSVVGGWFDDDPDCVGVSQSSPGTETDETCHDAFPGWFRIAKYGLFNDSDGSYGHWRCLLEDSFGVRTLNDGSFDAV